MFWDEEAPPDRSWLFLHTVLGVPSALKADVQFWNPTRAWCESKFASTCNFHPQRSCWELFLLSKLFQHPLNMPSCWVVGAQSSAKCLHPEGGPITEARIHVVGDVYSCFPGPEGRCQRGQGWAGITHLLLDPVPHHRPAAHATLWSIRLNRLSLSPGIYNTSKPLKQKYLECILLNITLHAEEDTPSPKEYLFWC